MAYLKGSSLTVPSNATSINAVDVNTQLTINILVRRPNRGGRTLQEHVDGLTSKTTEKLSYDEFCQQFAADEADINSVIQFATENNLTVVKSHSPSATISLTGNAGAFNNAFKITLLTITDSTKTYRSYVGQINVPDYLVDVIDKIIGLDNPVSFKRNTVKFHNDVSLQSLNPLQVAAAYNFPNSSAIGQCIGLIEIGGGFTTDNLSSSFATIGISPPTVEFASVDGQTNNPGLTTDAGNSPETMLDIFVTGAVAPGSKIIVYSGLSDIVSLANTIDTAVHDTTNYPGILSISIGADEIDFPDDVKNYYDQIFQQAAVLGITICVSSGDTGSLQFDQASGLYTVNASYPASSPYVLSIGGTTLELNNNNSIYSEIGWNNRYGASGGGVSATYPVPSWQSGLSITSYPSGITTALTARGVPDVSANGDPFSGYSFYWGTDNGFIIGVGGTSAAAPLWAGLIARFNALTSARAGFINPTLYANPSLFQDISAVGNNSLGGQNAYSVTTGWDAVTGLGTPNGNAILNYLIPPVPTTLSVTVPYGSPNYPIQILAQHGATGLYIVSNPTHGTITVSGTTIYYTSTGGYSGSDSLRYQATNAYGSSPTVTLNITISPPIGIVAGPVYQSVGYNSVNDVINLNLNTSPTFVRILSNPTNGTAVVYGTSILYTPNTGFNGPDQFNYSASNDGGTSAPATIYLTVLPPAPVSIDSSQSVPFNSVNNFINLIIGNYPTEVYLVTPPTKGTAFSTGTSIFYTPNLGYSGSDSLQFNASNDAGLSNTATVLITVSVPSLPIAANVSKSVAYDSSNNVINPSVTNYFNTVTVVTNPSHGVVIVSDNSFIYSPTVGYYGTDSFRYRVLNPAGISNTASVLITISNPVLNSFPTPGQLPGGLKNSSYSPVRLLATGGKAPYFSSLVSGSFPPGLTLNSSTNILSGITTSSGIYNFVIGVTDSSFPTGVSTSGNYSIIVYTNKVSGGFQWITSEGLLATTSSGGAVNVQLSTNDNSSTFTLLAGQLPQGLTLTSTGTIYGNVPPELFENTGLFTIRAHSPYFNKVADNTFYIDTLPVGGPVWNYETNPAILHGPSIGYTFIDREYVSVQLSTSNPSVATNPYNVKYKLASGFDSLPNGLTLTSDGVISGKLNVLAQIDTLNTFTVTIAASDGNIESLQTFIINVINADSLRSGSTMLGFEYGTSTIYLGTLTSVSGVFTSTVFDSETDLSTVQSPIFLINSNLGEFLPNEKMYVPVTAYDPLPFTGPVSYTTDTVLPFGLKVDARSGFINGYIPSIQNYLEIYPFTILATKKSNFDNVVITASNTFTFTVINANQGSINWATTSNLGSITLGIPSDLYVISTSTKQTTLYYSLVDGMLPPGLSIDIYGNILGTPTSTGTFNATLVSSINTGYNISTWGTITSSGIYPSAFSAQTFTINVLPSIIPYTNIYVKPLSSLTYRAIFNRFITNTSVFSPTLIYRPTDSNFGVQTVPKMYLEYGIQELNSSTDYLSALQQNYYKKSLYFGNVKSLTALDNNGNSIYDVVYVEIVDPLQGVKQQVTLHGKTYYPDSIGNMKNNLANLNSGTISINSNLLPLWQKTAINLGLGFINCVVLCYTFPKKGFNIVDRINSQKAFNFNKINFTIDRIIIENTLSGDETYLLFPNTDIQ